MMKTLTIVLSLFLSLAVNASTLPRADKVVVDKSERKLFLIKDDSAFRSYSISLGKNPVGHKMYEGDQRTPEGLYTLDWRNPDSRFYKSIHVSYPNGYDQNSAESRGLDPGGMIMIHGLPNQVTPREFELFLADRDWTDGCIAVGNEEMDEIWQAVADGTIIEIRP